METYPLESLLRVRHYRLEVAERSLARAQDACREAHEAHERASAALESWRAWRIKEVERRYEGIMGRALTIEALGRFHEGLAALADEELEHAAAVDAAKEAVGLREAELEAAKTAARAAKRSEAKLETHRSIWRDEQKLEAERAEDREFEDFRPVMRMDAGQEDADN